ncbi:hypothetical protein [Mycobacteroides abscessus]|uniref:hypothetical protein n=1 Tax=Mycobacteroides abscessus TaxID=36809 RepID=UPI0009A5964E|nr:hypothetical protein [Mycobacteroides abscessus]SKQ73037.1 Uncharacterised protein [Mycobacteroides abscessus subsp. massiliense]
MQVPIAHEQLPWPQNAVPAPTSARPWLDPELDAETRYVYMWAAATGGVNVDPAEVQCVHADCDVASQMYWLRAFGVIPNPTDGLHALAQARGVAVHQLKEEPTHV